MSATIAEAKSAVKSWLDKKGLHNKITAKTVSFADLARDSMVFVTVHNWVFNPDVRFSDLKEFAKSKNFMVEAKFEIME